MYTLQAAWCSAPLSISHSEFSVPFASCWSNFSGMKVSSNSTYVELWLVFLVNESVCSFQACPSTTLLSSTIVQNTWHASEHTIYSKKIGWASWSVLADCLWSWYARYSFHHCYVYYLTFIEIADTTGTKVSVSLNTKHASVLTGSPEDHCRNADVLLPNTASHAFPSLQHSLIQP